MKKLTYLMACLALLLAVYTPTCQGQGQGQQRLPASLYEQPMQVVQGDSLYLQTLPRHKPILLDFGGLYCSPCIVSLLKLDSLAPGLGDAIQLYMVTKEPADKVRKAKRANSLLRQVTLPIIVGDSVLNSRFDHVVEPHLVWLDSEGFFAGAIDYRQLSVELIQQFVKQERLDLPLKTDRRFPYKQGLRAILSVQEGFRQQQPVRQQWLTGYVEGIFPRGELVIDTLAHRVRYAAYNFPILRLYTNWYGKLLDINFFRNQLRFSPESLQELLPPLDPIAYAEWLRYNGYCYELEYEGIQPLPKHKDWIKQSLDLYFGLDVQLSTERQSCWLIAAADSKPAPLPTVQEIWSRVDVYSFCKAINSQLDHAIVVYRPEASTLQLTFSEALLTMGFDELKAYLASQGYTLDRQDRPVDFLRFRKP